MKKHSAFASVLVAVLLSAATTPSHAAKYNIKWYLGHPTLDYFEEAARNFKTEVETGSNGDVAVQIVLSHSDGESGPQIATMVEKGEVEMGHSFTEVLGGLDGRLNAFEAPYLFRDYRHMEGVIEGPLGAQMLDGFRAHNMVGLSFTYSGGASGVASVGREIRRPEDLKGLKVGVFGDAVNEAWLRSLGATPVAIGHDFSMITSLEKQGLLDAVVITWRNFERMELSSRFKRFNMQGSTYLVSATYINQTFFESLPVEYRKLISEASRKAGRIERAKTIEINESAKRQMMDKGVRPVYLTEAAQRDFVAALKPSYRDALDALIGKSFLEKVRKTAGGREHPAMPLDLVKR